MHQLVYWLTFGIQSYIYDTGYTIINANGPIDIDGWFVGS